jgi:uncharacterized protein YjdB
MKKKSLSVLIALSLTATTLLPAASVFADTTAATPVTTAPASTYGVEYEGHVQNIGWQTPVITTGDQTDISNVNEAGTDGKSLRVEAVKITGTNLPAGASITYKAQVENKGWMDAVTTTGNTAIDSAAEAGTDGQGLRVETFKMTLNGLPGYAIKYQTHVQNIGWQAPVTTENGTAIDSAAIAGTVGQGLRMEAVKIEIVKTDAEKAAEITAINAVQTAEASKSLTDEAAATTAVASVKDVAENAALTARIAAINTNFAVASVNAINADQLKVVFDKAVDKTSAETIGNYLLNNVTVAGTPALQADGKTVIITLTTPLTNGNTNVYQVKPVKSADLTATTPIYTSTESFSDTTAPTVTSATSTTNGATATSVTVNYSEPVASGVVKIDGVGHAVTAGATTDTFTGLSLDATKSHTIEYVNLTDEASTANVTADGTLAFNITTDATAPVISSLSQLSDKQVLVTFNKAIKASTIQAAGSVTATAIDGATVTPYTVSSVTANPNDTTGTQYIVTIGTSPIYTSTVTSHNVILGFTNAITDTVGAGNALTATTKNITLTKDTSAPAVTSITTKKDSTGVVTDVIVNYSKPLAAHAAIAPAGLTITDSNGVLIAPATVLATSNAVNANDTQVDFPLAAAASTFNSKYTISVPASLVTDEAEGLNPSTAASGTIDLTQAASATPFKLALHSASNTAGDVITVNYGTAVKGGAIAGSSTDPNNYSINGNVLPAGTSITLNAGQTTATITLPKGFIPTTDANAVFRIANVQRLSDSTTITPYVDTFTATDNTAPVLQSANVIDANTIILTYNEAVTATGNVGTSFSILNNGTAIDPAAADVTASAVAGYPNKIKLTLVTAPLDVTKSITIGAINSGVTDTATNIQAATSQITATQN